MEDPAADDPLLDMIKCIAGDVLARIGDDAEMRFAFFRQFVELAKRTVHAAETGQHWGRH